MFWSLFALAAEIIFLKRKNYQRNPSIIAIEKGWTKNMKQNFLKNISSFLGKKSIIYRKDSCTIFRELTILFTCKKDSTLN